jgi:hypothetical protein
MIERIVRGIPTRTDVEVLIKTYGDPAEGELIPWDSLASTLCLDRVKNRLRFQTVIAAWRRRLEREANIYFVADPGVGLVVTDPHNRVGLSHSYHKRSLRSATRAGAIAAGTDSTRLTPEEKRANDFYQRIPALFRMASVTEAKKLPTL